MAKSRRKVTQEEKFKVLQLLAENKTYKEIAEELERPNSTTQKIIDEVKSFVVGVNERDRDTINATAEPTENIEEVTLDCDTNNLETITLKKPDEVYLEIYEEARKKAKEAKKQAGEVNIYQGREVVWTATGKGVVQ